MNIISSKKIKMGALDYLSNFCTVTSTRGKRKPIQTVEIRVKLDCDGCERRVKNAVRNLKGVRSLEVNRKQNRVTVSGFIDASKSEENRKKSRIVALYTSQSSSASLRTSGLRQKGAVWLRQKRRSGRSGGAS